MKKRKRILIYGLVALVVLTVAIVLGFAYREYKKHSAICQHYEDRLTLFETENSQLKKGEVDVLFLGDSLTQMYDVDKYYPQYKTLNRGISGDTTFTLHDRLELSAYEVEPEICTLLIGTNNYDDMFENYEQILKDLKKHMPDTKVVVLSLTPVAQDWIADNDTVKAKNIQLEELAQKHNCTYVDVFTQLYDENADSIIKEYVLDSVHLTEKGYKVITDILTPVLSELTEK